MRRKNRYEIGQGEEKMVERKKGRKKKSKKKFNLFVFWGLFQKRLGKIYGNLMELQKVL